MNKFVLTTVLLGALLSLSARTSMATCYTCAYGTGNGPRCLPSAVGGWSTCYPVLGSCYLAGACGDPGQEYRLRPSPRTAREAVSIIQAIHKHVTSRVARR